MDIRASRPDNQAFRDHLTHESGFSAFADQLMLRTTRSLSSVLLARSERGKTHSMRTFQLETHAFMHFLLGSVKRWIAQRQIHFEL